MTNQDIEARNVTVGQHVLTADGFYGEVTSIKSLPSGYLNIRLLVTIAGGKATRRPMRMTHTIRRDNPLFIEA